MDTPLETMLSFGDEARGMVVLRGEDLAVLAEQCSYEDVAARLWRDVVDDGIDQGALGQARVRQFRALAPLAPSLAGRDSADAMRVLLAASPVDSPVDLVAAVGLAAACAIRGASGQTWREPDAASGHAADLLAIATGTGPDERIARALERYMILMIDHGISASTYAARIAASTGAGLLPVALAALAVLEGPKHGGAPALVLDQLDRIGSAASVPAYVAQERAAGRRLMGFGSRAYAGTDLRGAMMRREWEAIGGAAGHRGEAVAIEAEIEAELAKGGKPLRANVEYYASLLLEACGLPRAGFTPFFAAARAPGWVAHAAEQRATGRMIRPSSRYVGAVPQ